MHGMSLMKQENPVFFKTGCGGLGKLKFVHRESIVSSHREIDIVRAEWYNRRAYVFCS
jgi:hypothetical protein